MKILAVLLITVITSVHAFWGENNANWSPFGSGTGHNNTAPWGANSNWIPFTTSGSWAPKHDVVNLSRYGVYPQSLMQYRKDPRFYSTYSIPVSQSMVKPSNWLTETDFTSTLRNFGDQGKTFIVDDFSSLGSPEEYVFAKADTTSVDRVLRNYAPYINQPVVTTGGIYGKQSYSISPAALSTQKIDNK